MTIFFIKLFKSIFAPLLLFCYMVYLGFVLNLHQLNSEHKRLLIGEPYNENYIKFYKWNRDIDSISIIAIGSSRVLQFKSEFFNESFFNLGYLVGTPKQTLELIKHKNLKNKTLIISLDQWAFNSNWSKESSNFVTPENPSFFRSSFSNNRLIDVLKFKIRPNFKNICNSDLLKIGAGATMALDGVINDGSYYYGKTYHGLLNDNKELIGEDYLFKNTKDRIKNGNRRFEYGFFCDPKALNDFQDLVQYNKKMGNTVYYFFPPFAPSVQRELSNPNYHYIQDAIKKVSKISENHNVKFFDFTYFPSADSEYIDGFHGGSHLYYELLKNMGLQTRDCNFLNQYETVNDSALSLERKCFFTSSKTNQNHKDSN